MTGSQGQVGHAALKPRKVARGACARRRRAVLLPRTNPLSLFRALRLCLHYYLGRLGPMLVPPLAPRHSRDLPVSLIAVRPQASPTLASPVTAPSPFDSAHSLPEFVNLIPPRKGGDNKGTRHRARGGLKLMRAPTHVSGPYESPGGSRSCASTCSGRVNSVRLGTGIEAVMELGRGGAASEYWRRRDPLDGSLRSRSIYL